ncbi:MAG: cellobiose system component [Actinomycetota bacterium]|nr:cellobiose system component [Actinomycetota bacterium]
MDMILVVCGAGASSTFLASRIRALATMRHLDLTASAGSSIDIDASMVGAQVLLVGPHLAAEFPQLEATATALHMRAALLPEDAFGPNGADNAIDLALKLLASPLTEGTPHA